MRNVIVSFTLIAALVLSFNVMFTFAVPTQEYSCLNASYFLVDKTDKSVSRERLIAFKLPAQTPYFNQGTRWIKKLVGMPGDTIKVTKSSVFVNDIEYKNDMNTLLMKLNMDAASVEREMVLDDDEYFVVGETYLSYDSRFWGVISQKDVIGNAYAIL
ncbi:signal peptidase I [Shewanella aestuarii]|uniref:Signal peptidase I n=1 Tax=Shewanella aestuarii TaxID=1028752 RepID=A0A6G9QQD4_9GAMM|nr:signal peptidase I [Shewanella aestuarii]QIR16323.1 signal peptidase I [Shewanella aestuarii]